MKSLTIKTTTGETASLMVRVVPGIPPEGTGTVYELIDKDGKPSPASFKATEGKHIQFSFFDCIEVVNSEAFAYRWLAKERLHQIGIEVGNG